MIRIEVTKEDPPRRRQCCLAAGGYKGVESRVGAPKSEEELSRPVVIMGNAMSNQYEQLKYDVRGDRQLLGIVDKPLKSRKRVVSLCS